MSSNSAEHSPAEVVRVPATEVADFIAARNKQAQKEAKALRALDARKAEITAARAELRDLQAEFDQRVENEAEEIAERSAERLREKTHAETVVNTLLQASQIAADYAKLERWITDLVSASVASVLGTLDDADVWRQIIHRAISDMGNRWKLTLCCHPDDYAAITQGVSAAQLSDAVSDLRSDPSVSKGTCLIEDSSELLEVNLSAQIDALIETLRDLLAAAPGDEVSQ